MIECVLCEEDYEKSKMGKCPSCGRNICLQHLKEKCSECGYSSICEDCLLKHGDNTGHQG